VASSGTDVAAESHLAVSCDAPGCSETLTHDGAVLFASFEDVRAAIDDLNWIIFQNHRGLDEFYCPGHWRYSFGLRQPYWGRRVRRQGF
jgi:hypothetical protein